MRARKNPPRDLFHEENVVKTDTTVKIHSDGRYSRGYLDNYVVLVPIQAAFIQGLAF